MSLENGIKKVIDEAINSGMIEESINNHIEKCVNKAVEDLFDHWGKATKIIKGKIEEVMIPQLEGYDYSKYVVKLDNVLTDIMKNTTVDNAKILNNFKSLMIEDIPKEIKTSEIFEKYCEFVSQNASKDNLEINYDDGEPTYEYFEVTYEVEENEGRSWSSWKNAILIFECEHDEEMNFQARLTKWERNDHWTLEFKKDTDIQSLRHINEFEIFLTRLNQNHTKIIMDKTDGTADVELEEKPEASWS